MGLIRCPKCDAICHTEEEVCHYCGYRLKPEVKKEEPILDSDSLEDKKIETEEDPFVAFGYKEDPFEEYDKQIENSKYSEEKKSSSNEGNEFSLNTNGEPAWIDARKRKLKRSRIILFLIALIFGIAFFVSLYLLKTDKEVHRYDAVVVQGIVFQEEEYQYFEKVEYIVSTPILGWMFLMFSIAALYTLTYRFFVKKIEGYYVVVSKSFATWNLIIDNKQVDSHFSKREIGYRFILRGLLPNKKTLLITIELKGFSVCPIYEIIDSDKQHKV